ncbi:GSCFA domain-containing protein [Hymenobacter rubripertinctus]|uniref:GSCFA domain-containing protein n=1 Tax=Hymenobacter rubripertinctus TaxID=2029981 RepID=A0A418R426_9BACT|nr:GSCFA domain-containing protein [Hymenobacter rubripertinctus]RIY12198.1 hypothetical protein D0T11_06045 [Hymenobacter rubripertinctus]
MFRTELPLTPHPQQLPPSARVLTIGSCFSDTIGSRLTEFKVATMANPFGTVFNPISACKLLRAAAGEDMDWQQHLVEARGRWQNHDLHAELGADTPVELLQRIQTMTREAGVFLATADVVVLTLGSAFAYRLRETGELINNCHKIAGEKFDKELLTADDIIAAVAETHAYLRRINPKLRFILTVSPVRHLKDTLVLNSASKAMLRVACHYLSELLPDVTYFPAYELLMDDLRDYRFYASDMLHPSEVAENYVWERFTRTYFDAAFGRFKKEWEGIRQSLNHRPLYPASPEHREFLATTLERLRKVAGQADVRMELLHVERELANLPLPVVSAAPEPEDYDDGEERIDIGSFDEEPAVAAAPAAPAPPAPTPAATRRPAPAERKPVRAPEPREDSDDDDATDRGQARILRPGFGVLLEDEDEEHYDDHQAAATPTETLATSESAYDQAYSAAALAESEQDDSDAETEGEPEHRKKRRSRGGAKRTKRKNARLAAEQTSGELQPESSVVAVQPAPADAIIEQSDDETATEVVYVTEEELRRPRRNPDSGVQATDEPTTAPEAASETAATNEEAPAEEATGNRRSRNNRRGGKRESPERTGGRAARQPLYAAETEAPVATGAEAETTPAPAAAEALATLVAAVAVTAEGPTKPATTAPAAPEAVPAPAKKKPAARRKPAAKTPTATPAETTKPQALATEQSGQATTVTPAPAAVAEAPVAVAKAPVAKKPARRKPAAKPKPVAAATPETAVPAPTAPPATEAAAPVKAAPRKRAPAKPKAKPAAPVAGATPAPTVIQPEAKPKAEAAPAAKATPASKPKAAAKAPAKAKTAAAVPKAAAQLEEALAAKPAAKAKAPAKPRKTAPAAAKSEPVEKPAAKKPAAKPKAKAPARKKATPEPPAAAENN